MKQLLEIVCAIINYAEDHAMPNSIEWFIRDIEDAEATLFVNSMESNDEFSNEDFTVNSVKLLLTGFVKALRVKNERGLSDASDDNDVSEPEDEGSSAPAIDPSLPTWELVPFNFVDVRFDAEPQSAYWHPAYQSKQIARLLKGS